MIYATATQFKVKYDVQNLGHLVDDTGGDEAVKATLEAFINDASAFIDTYVGTRYTLPLPSIPGELRRANLIVANFDLESKKPPISDDQQAAYDDIIAWLQMIKDGELDLTVGVIRTDIAAFMDSETSVFTEPKFVD